MGTVESTLLSTIATGLGSAAGGSPHAAGIIAAQNALSASTAAKAIVLMTDGLSNQTAAANAATAAKTNNIRIATVGIGGDADAGDLQGWATQTDYYQAGGSGFLPNELVKDVGAAVAVPVDFTVVETAGTHFALSSAVGSAGTTVVPGREP